jgi:DNA-binding response OmpR family regulator
MSMTITQSRSVYTLAGMELDIESRELVGPRGHHDLADKPFRVLERLMRRPGILVSCSDLLIAMYPDGDEPDTAENVLRHQIRRLRNLVDMITGTGRVWIRNESGVGYAIGERKRAKVMA